MFKPLHWPFHFCRKYFRALTAVCFVTLLVAISALTGAYRHYEQVYKNQLYSEANLLDEHTVGLVLGTSPWTQTGSSNLYFESRMDAAAKLYHAGKVKVLLLSGDNGTTEYNEPLFMKRALLERGVPANALIADYAGFRTFDSVVRCQKVFGQSKVLIISQEFHALRALGIANSIGLEAKAFAAPMPQLAGTNRFLLFREAGARLICLLDCYVLNTQPRFLGDPIEVSVPEQASAWD
jgi:SanA protein